MNNIAAQPEDLLTATEEEVVTGEKQTEGDAINQDLTELLSSMQIEAAKKAAPKKAAPKKAAPKKAKDDEEDDDDEDDMDDFDDDDDDFGKDDFGDEFDFDADPDFEEFDMPKSKKGKTTTGGKKKDDDDFDDDFGNLDIFNDGFDDEDDF